MSILRRVIDSAAVAIAVLSGFGLVAGPDAVRIAVVFYALCLVPGNALRRLFFEHSGGAVEAVCDTFVLGIVFASLAVCVGFIPGFSYDAISIVAGSAALLLVWLPKRGAPDGGRSRGEGAPVCVGAGPRFVSWLVLVVAFAACFFALYDRGELGWGTDALDHVSYVRRGLESGTLFPRDSFYREGDGAAPDPRKGLWHPVLARWTHESNVPVHRLWSMAPALIAFFALCVFYGFAASLCGPGSLALLSVAALVLLGGDGVSWLAKLGFSRNMALVLFWADVHLVIRYCRLRRPPDLAAAALVGATGAAFHLSFALIAGAALAGILCFVLFAREGREWRGAFARAAVLVLAGIAVPLALRAHEAGAAFNAIHTHRQGMLVISEALAVVDPAEIAARLGPAFFYVLAAAPFYFMLTRGLERRGLAFSLFAVPVILVLTPFTATLMERRIGYLHYRMLDAAPAAVLLVLALAGLARAAIFGTSGRSRRERGRQLSPSRIAARAVAVLALAVFAWYPLRIAVHRIAAAAAPPAGRRDASPSRYVSLFRALERRIPRHSVIVSDPQTSYILSAYTDHFIAATLDQHGSPTDTLALERLEAVRDLMSPAVSLAAGARWLAETGADYLLVNDLLEAQADFFGSVLPGGAAEARRKFDSCPALVEPALALEGFRLYRVVEGGAERGDPRCTEALSGAVSCGAAAGAGAIGEDDGERLLFEGGVDAGAGVVLARAELDRFTLRTIDTLTGYFCWTSSGRIPFGLPLEVVIRLDGDFPKGPLYREWYGKQYRRIAERREGRFRRATWTLRLRSGFAYPDMWERGRPVRQDFAIPVPHAMAPGAYELRIKVRRVPYLPVRTPADYLSNDDSQQGAPIAMIYLQ